MPILIDIWDHFTQLFVEVFFLIKNVVLIIGLFQLIIGKHVECIADLLLSHVVISENTWITSKIGILLVLQSFEIEVLGRLEILKLRESLDLKYIIESLRSLCDKVLGVHVELTSKNEQVNEKFGGETDLHV